MNFFSFDIKKLVVLALLVAFPLFSVNMQKYSPNRPWILEPFFFFAGTAQEIFADFSSGVRQTTDLYLNLVDIKKNNRELNQEIAKLKAQLGALTELKLENERLSQLLEFQRKLNLQLLAARIIGRDLLPGYHTVMIDRGEAHGVRKGMATMTISGVVGYIIEVKSRTSQILLLTDQNAVVDGIVQRSRARGIVQGTGSEPSLTHMNRDDDVAVDDLIVTSGLDNIFPKGFPIAKVKSLKVDKYGLGQRIGLTPIINTNNLEELFVVINANQQDLENLNRESGSNETDPKNPAVKPTENTKKPGGNP